MVVRAPRAVVTGGAGFVGSWLCERLLMEGHSVVVLDNLVTGSAANLEACAVPGRLEFVEHDVTRPFDVAGPVSMVFHLASPASPLHYAALPVETLRVGSLGTENALRLAARKGARFVLASTSEVYGDPLVHPQEESYWGNVNPIGPRSVYDEAKRYAEALTTAYRNALGVNTGIARIFNTYGPRMSADDGRVVPAFVDQALAGRPITVAGDGSQTRSLCYVTDTVEALYRLARSGMPGPVNIGNDTEVTVLELARLIRAETCSGSSITMTERPVDDPGLRRPDLTRALRGLHWSPRVELATGIAWTVDSRRGRSPRHASRAGAAHGS